MFEVKRGYDPRVGKVTRVQSADLHCDFLTDENEQRNILLAKVAILRDCLQNLWRESARFRDEWKAELEAELAELEKEIETYFQGDDSPAHREAQRRIIQCKNSLTA